MLPGCRSAACGLSNAEKCGMAEGLRMSRMLLIAMDRHGFFPGSPQGGSVQSPGSRAVSPRRRGGGCRSRGRGLERFPSERSFGGDGRQGRRICHCISGSKWNRKSRFEPHWHGTRGADGTPWSGRGAGSSVRPRPSFVRPPQVPSREPGLTGLRTRCRCGRRVERSSKGTGAEQGRWR